MATGDVTWDGSTRSVRPSLMYKTVRGFTYGQTTNQNYSTQARDAAYKWAGASYSTGDDLIRIPFRTQGDLQLEIDFVCCEAAAQYPGIILQKPPFSKNAVYGYSTDKPAATLGTGLQPTSTNDAGWAMFISPSTVTSAATSMAHTVYFRFHPGRYAFNDGGSTGEGTNAYENYIVMAPVLTAAKGNSDTLASTQFVSLQCSSFGFNIAHVRAIELI